MSGLIVAFVGGMLTNRWILFALVALVAAFLGSLITPLWHLATKMWLG